MNPTTIGQLCTQRVVLWSAAAVLVTLSALPRLHATETEKAGGSTPVCEAPPAVSIPAETSAPVAPPKAPAAPPKAPAALPKPPVAPPKPPAPSSNTGAGQQPVSSEVTLTPDRIDHSMLSGEPEEIELIRVTNNGSKPIASLYFSSLGLHDSKGRSSVSFASQSATVQIAPGGWVDCKLRLPHPEYAGSYTGTVQLAVNGVSKAALATTVRTRGPWQTSRLWIPFALFAAVVLAGWGVSSVLNTWINNRLPRVQVAIALKEAQSDLGNFLEELGNWQITNDAGLPNTGAAIAFDKADVDLAVSRIDTYPLDDLKQLAQRSRVAVRMNNYLYALLQFVAKTFAKSNIPPKTHSLDSVTRTGDANAYRAALQAALQSAPVAPETKLAPAPAGPLTQLSTVKLYMRIREMESLHQVVVTIVVWLSAYAFFYEPNLAFGTFLDYSTVFLWALGLTQAGAQIVSSIHKP